MDKPSEVAEHRGACGVLSVSIVAVKGMEYRVDVNHFNDYHRECLEES